MLFLVIFSMLILPKVFTIGIFVDGMTYASISRNLSEGISSFFKPTYTLTIYREFYEHPPLQFYLESLFFKLLGDKFYTERIYSILVGFLSLTLLAFTVKILSRFEKVNIPLFSASFVLILIPLTSWIMLNNMLENTLVLFLILSFVFLLFSIYINSVFALFSGIFLFLAFFTKGPVALFVIIFPILYYKEINFSRMVMIYLLLMFGFCIFLFIPGVLEYLSIYFKNQVISSIIGKREIVGNRLDPIFKTIRELLIPFLFLLMLSIFKKFRITISKISLKLLLLSLFAIFPLTISPKQMDWYVYPSFPFFSLAIAFIFKDTLKFLDELLKNKILSFISLIIVIFSVFIMILNYGKPIKYEEFHNSFSGITFSSHRIVGICPKEEINNWEIIALTQRYLKFSIYENVDSVVFSHKNCNLNCKMKVGSGNYFICFQRSQ
ncbi:MAG: glycosyltransferase family 39 protein [candidate division WOR-3 bacterium]|nr:glycosyltransferase family 39 protein [candidate division WOR-3 bacterium]MCX7948060.1 glycosyltransferase family 39 protein [candidate division WOR-3 bacterium]MDW8151002.1 glycosyltransferase family 39 protein [candidate division WOR-3 bacterium]